MPDLLHSVSEPERSRFLQTCRSVRLRKGDVIAREGEIGDCLFLVESGCLSASTTTADGEPQLLDIAGAGAVLGEMALIRSDKARTATLTAITDVQLKTLTAEKYQRLRKEYPAVDEVLLTLLADRVERLTRQLSEQRFLSLDRRVARRLCQIADVFGGLSTDLSLPVKQQDVADLVGAMRPTVNAVLNKLHEIGAILLSRGVITVRDADLLREQAGLS